MTGYYDIHCHILPGIDDGAKNVETALEMLYQEYNDGVRTIFVTPHYRSHMFEPSSQEVFSIFLEIKKKAALIGQGINIILGCEFHANMDIIEILNSPGYWTMGKSQCVLIEFSFNDEYQYIRERCYKLRSHGYQPIIAHVERYKVLNKYINRIETLVEMGVLIQVNANSVLGKNGFAIKRFCRKLINYDLVHFIGSDAHDMLKRPPLIGECAKYLDKKMGKAYTRKILIRNPQKYIVESR